MNRKVLLLAGPVLFGVLAAGAQSVTQDTLAANALYKRADSLLNINRHDSSMDYLNQALVLYQKHACYLKEAACLNLLSNNLWRLGRYKESLPMAQKALAMADKMPSPNLQQAVANENIAINHDDNNRFAQAYHYYMQALHIKQALKGDYDYEISGTYNNLGIFFCNKGDYDSALFYNEKALALRKKMFGPESAPVSGSLNNIGTIYEARSEFQKALDYFREALAIRLKTLPKGHSEIGVSYCNIGLVAGQLGDFPQAIEALKKAQAIYLSVFGPDHIRMATLYENLASLYYYLGDYEKVVAYAKLALPIELKAYGPNSPEAANSYINIAAANIDEGNYDLGLQYHEKALDIRRAALGDHNFAVGLQWVNVGVGYLYKNELEKAQACFTTALKLQQHLFGAQYTELGKTYHNIGLVYLARKNYPRALDYFRRALEVKIRVYGKDGYLTASTYKSIGDTYQSMDAEQKAMENFDEALRIFRKNCGEKTPFISDLYNSMALSFESTGDLKNALKSCQQALISNIDSFNDRNPLHNPGIDTWYNPLYLLQSFRIKGVLFEKSYRQSRDPKDLQEALQALGLADRLADKIRNSHFNTDDQLTLGNYTEGVYKTAVDVCAQLNRLFPAGPYMARAFYFSEKGKAAVLSHELAGDYAMHFAGIPEKDQELEKELKLFKAYYESKLGDVISDTGRTAQIRSHLFTINRRYDSLLTAIEKNYPRYYQLKYENDIAGFTRLQQQLPDAATAMLSYFISDSTAYIFLITKNKTEMISSTAGGDPDSLIMAFRKKIDPDDIVQKAKAVYDHFFNSSHALYRWLIAPVQGQLQTIRHLVIIPYGNLSLLPFGMLVSDMQPPAIPDYRQLHYLVKDYAISYAYSATLWSSPFSGTENWKYAFGGFAPSYTGEGHADTNIVAAYRRFGKELTNLPYAGDEVKEAAGLLGGQVFTGREATEAKFKQEAGKYEVLHLAMHALVNEANPLYSALIFAPEKDSLQDGFLNAYELYDMTIHADLGVLSACNTGVGRLANGEGVMSVSRAFRYAGCRSLVMSLWQADDKATATIMESFYKNLAAGQRKDDALRNARLAYLDAADPLTAHPYFWGAFIASGDMRPLQSSRGHRNAWLLFIGSLMGAGVAGTVWYRKRRRRKMASKS